MLRSSPYYHLKWRVDCCSNGALWETIVAFNCETPARRYAIDCQLANAVYQYRVMKRTSKGWVQC